MYQFAKEKQFFLIDSTLAPRTRYRNYIIRTCIFINCFVSLILTVRRMPNRRQDTRPIQAHHIIFSDFEITMQMLQSAFGT